MADKDTFSYLICRDVHAWRDAMRENAQYQSDYTTRIEVMYRNRVMASIETALCFHSASYVAKAIFHRSPEVYLDDLRHLTDTLYIYLNGVSAEQRSAFVAAYRKEVNDFADKIQRSKTLTQFAL